MFASVNLSLEREICCCVCFFADDCVLTWVVNTSLDDVIHGEATRGGFAPQLGIDVLGKYLQ